MEKSGYLQMVIQLICLSLGGDNLSFGRMLSLLWLQLDRTPIFDYKFKYLMDIFGWNKVGFISRKWKVGFSCLFCTPFFFFFFFLVYNFVPYLARQIHHLTWEKKTFLKPKSSSGSTSSSTFISPDEGGVLPKRTDKLAWIPQWQTKVNTIKIEVLILHVCQKLSGHSTKSSTRYSGSFMLVEIKWNSVLDFLCGEFILNNDDRLMLISTQLVST